MLGEYSADDIWRHCYLFFQEDIFLIFSENVFFFFFFLVFPKNRFWYFMQIVSWENRIWYFMQLGDNLHETLILFSGNKKEKNVISLSSAELAKRVVKVKFRIRLSKLHLIMLLLTLFYCLTLVYYVGADNSGDVRSEEPRCYSRFDYEFKTLQSVVTLTESDRYLREITARLQNEIEELKLEKQRMLLLFFIYYPGPHYVNKPM